MKVRWAVPFNRERAIKFKLSNERLSDLTVGALFIILAGAHRHFGGTRPRQVFALQSCSGSAGCRRRSSNANGLCRQNSAKSSGNLCDLSKG